MLKVHHLNNSRSQRVLWLLEELGHPYEIVHYQRDAKTNLAPQALLKIHPLGKSPVLEDGGFVLAETGAIVEYIIEKYGRHLQPDAGSPLYWRYRYWLHYAEGSAMPPLLMKLIIGRLGIFGRPARGFVDRQIKLHLDYLESEVAKTGWFVGDGLTGADIMLSFPLEAARSRAGLGKSRPKLMEFLSRIHARPAYQTALKKGGPYVFAQ